MTAACGWRTPRRSTALSRPARLRATRSRVTSSGTVRAMTSSFTVITMPVRDKSGQHLGVVVVEAGAERRACRRRDRRGAAERPRRGTRRSAATATLWNVALTRRRAARPVRSPASAAAALPALAKTRASASRMASTSAARHRRQLLELARARSAAQRRAGRAAMPRRALGVIGVERRLERRVLGQRGRGRELIAGRARLERREHRAS